MNKETIITLGAMSLIGFVGLNIKNIFNFIGEHLKNYLSYSLKVEESSEFFYIMQKFLLTEHQSKIHNFYYKTFYDSFVSDNIESQKTFFNHGYITFKHKGSRVLIIKENENIANTMTPYKNNKQSFLILCFNKNTLQDILGYINDNYGKDDLKMFFNNNGSVSLLSLIPNKTFDNIFLNDSIKENIQNDINNFLNSKTKYDSLGLKYKRVYLFYGEAGTGKSSLTTAIANYTKRDVLSINKSKDMTDETLINLIANRPEKSIIVFEDVDCLFENLNRETEKKDEDKKETITLSCLLNILDGSYTPNDVIFILTTNHIDKLDDAIKRDGRTNLMVNITKPNNETKLKYINYLKSLDENIDIDINDVENKTLSSIEKHYINK